jgi:hypothetical protein
MALLIKEFFIGGKAFFTVKVPEAFASEKGCNLHYTYHVEQAEPNDKFPNPAHFLKLLTGPDNTKDYSYLAILNPKTGEIRTTARSCANDRSWAVRIARRVLAQVFEGEGIAACNKAGWEVEHMGRCGRCSRPLTVPESLECGIGPDCAEKMGIAYPTRTKAKKPRVSKKAAMAQAITEAAVAPVAAQEPEIDPASFQEPPQTPTLPADEEVWF